MHHSRRKKIFIFIIFILQLLINWAYSLWVQTQPYLEPSGWITLLPLLEFFYFALSIIASAELFRETKLGLSMAFAIVLFETVMNTMSYNFVTVNKNLFLQLLIVLIIMNCFVLFMMLYHRKHYK